MTLEHLRQPFAIGALQTSNRLVMPPMATNFASPEGLVTDRQIAYYVARARGGVGYLTVEHTGILNQGKASPHMLLIANEAHGRSLQGLVAAVHQAGRPIVVQINHAGRQTASAVTGEPIVGPSPLRCPTRQEVPRELSADEIRGLTAAFAAAAGRVKAAGADGVEVHMAHGYLLCSFLSPFSNKRTDAYGGGLEGRVRFPVEVLQAVRKEVGPGFPIICRLSGDEYVEGGLTVAETRRIAVILEREGADALHVSACNAASGYLNHPPYYVPEGVFVHLAEAVKAVVKIPVITVGRIRNPVMADQIIAAGRADLVSMGRALLADPELPGKALAGRLEEITPCLSCNKCIQTLRQGPVACAVNPETGHELSLRLAPAATPKRVWVIGGGPGGMKAAEIAARRGHRVTLWERSGRLGGRLRLAALPPGKETINDFLGLLERRVRAAGVDVRLGREFTLPPDPADRPDHLLVATGARPARPPLPGLEGSGALSVDQAFQADPASLKGPILIVGGGGVGAELADYLSERGQKVTVVEMLPEIAVDLVGHLKHYLTQRLKAKGLTILTGTRVQELGQGFAVVADAAGSRRLEGFATIILALGNQPEDEVARKLAAAGLNWKVLGDARQPRSMLEALYEAAEAAGEL